LGSQDWTKGTKAPDFPRKRENRGLFVFLASIVITVKPRITGFFLYFQWFAGLESVRYFEHSVRIFKLGPFFNANLLTKMLTKI